MVFSKFTEYVKVLGFMRYFTAIILTTLFLSSQAQALTEADVGEYAVIHRDGSVTNKVFRVRQVEGAWRLEDKKPNGQWEDVTCVSDCKLRESSQADLERFFMPSDLAQIKVSCMHNVSFAFCSYSPLSQPNVQGYVLVALVATQPVHIRLARAKTSS
jgi:hypothetical protein